MLLTKPQLSRFWRAWSAIVSANNWPHDQAERERHALLSRAGFRSLTEVDHLNGFTAVLKELAILQENLTGMLYADENPRRVLIHTIRKLADEPYIVALAASSRFQTSDWTALDLVSLEQLRFTLSDRQVGQHRPATAARRRSAPRSRITDHESRITFPEYASENAPF